MPTITTARAHEHESLDALCHRITGSTAGGIVEQTLAANPGLAAIAADLPAGHHVNIVSAPKRATQTIQLWD